MQEVVRVSGDGSRGDGSRLERLGSGAARSLAIAGRAAFASHRAEIDDLNVDGGPELSAVIAASAREGRPDLEVCIIDGGQALFPLLLGVE